MEVTPTAFQTEILTLTFNPLRAIVMTDEHAKGQHQRSLGWKQTDRRTEVIALPSMLQ